MIYNYIKKIASKTNSIGWLSRILKTIDKKFREEFAKEIIEIDRGSGKKLFILDKGDSLRLSFNKNYEEKEGKIFKKHIKEGDIVVDAGAHIGFNTIYLAILVGENGMVYAFEPHPETFKTLKQNIRLSGLNNVIPIKKALSNIEGKSFFNISKFTSTSNSLLQTKETNKQTIVETTTLDSYDINPSFIKIDIEGSEPMAWEGMQKTLKRNPNAKIMIEYMPFLIINSGIDPIEYIKELEQEYKLFDITKNSFTNSQELSKNYSVKKENGTNLLLTRPK